MLEHFNANAFSGVVLDEAGILKSYSGKVKQQIIDTFRETKYRLACTATPAPNDHMEIGNHAEFLGVMPSNEMLARWFINDTMHFGRYRVKGHAIQSFWEWVATWAVSLNMPSDLGYDDDGFVLPELRQELRIVPADLSHASEGMLFRIPDLSATGMHKEMRLTAEARAKAVAGLVNGSTDPWIIWCNTNYEADALKQYIENATDLRGSDSLQRKEQVLVDFSEGRIDRLISKPVLAGFGLNWQHCAHVAYAGLSYSFETFYQSMRRCWRFGQKRPVNVYIFISDTERPLYNVVMGKAAAHEEMQRNMFKAATKVKQLREDLILSTNRDVVTKKGNGWEMRCGDSCQVMPTIESDSLDFSIFSPPFSSLYIYSDSLMDMGNSSGDEEFFAHFRFIIPELLRATRPGRLCAAHCKNLVYYKNQRGTAGLRDFRGEIIREFVAAGWDYHSEVTIWKDPVTEMQRTKAHGLLHKQLCKDSSFSRQGLPDYLVIFRKWADEESTLISPVVGKNSEIRFPDSYVGDEGPTNVQSERDHSIQTWQRYASPVWFDIRQTDVLNVRCARDSGDEKHLCPLQLPVIARAIHLWTNPGDLVFSPFAGIGSEGFIAIRDGRRFLGVELKESYWKAACDILRDAEREAIKNSMSLFAKDAI
jgi:superfamily II DNA or RNA helicase